MTVVRVATAAGLLVCLSGAVEARTRNGDRFYAQGKAAEQRKQWDAALNFYEQALSEDAGHAAYQLAARRVRFQAGQSHVDQGQKHRAEGKLEQALAEFEKAYAIDPGSAIAELELRRTLEMIAREKKRTTPATPEERGLTPAEQAIKESQERVASIQPMPELKPLSRAPITLRMNNQPPKVMFDTVVKLAGINVVFDPEYQPQVRNGNLELTNSTLEAALDYLAIMTKSFWKPLSANTIFVTMDNPTKRRDFEDSVVKVFYLKNLTTPQELQEISTNIRAITEIRRVFPYNAQNAVLVRGTPDQVALAEKIVQDLDKPRAEVVVDVLVLESSRVRSRDLAAAITSQGGAGIDTQILFTPRNRVLLNDESSSATSTTVQQLISLARVGKISTNDYSIALPGAVLQAMLSDSGTKILQSPQVRSVDGQKASLRIGDQVPIATGSYQPGVGTVGISPLVSTQFQYKDVGIIVDVTPKVHGGSEVSLHAELEISTVRDRIDVGGLQQPVIGQRKVVHDIRLKEGEVSLLSGLVQTQETRSVSGVPGLSTIPVLGRLFSSETVDRNESELLIALIPHVVRTPEISDVNLRGVAAGSDTVVRLNYQRRSRGDDTPESDKGQATSPGQVPQ